MNDDRIKAAAEWAKSWSSYLSGDPALTDERRQRRADAAHILSLLASGKAVLCEAEPLAWEDVDGFLDRDPSGSEGDCPLHPPLDPWSTT